MSRLFWMVIGYLALGCAAQSQEWRGTSAQQIMSATTAAPVGARGFFSLDGSILTLELQGLRQGNYSVSIVAASDDALHDLGFIPIVDPGLQPDREAGDSRKEDSLTHQSEVLSCKVQIQLPPGFNPKDFEQVLVSDPGGNVLLDGPPRK